MGEMNRLEFLQSVSSGNIVELICKYFDQNMALYNLISNNLDNVIISQTGNENDVKFDIRFKNFDSKMNNMLSTFTDNGIVSCYGKLYNTRVNSSDDKIEITFIEVAE